MKSILMKRGQSEIITTVLLVLVALAAVAAVAYFIINQVRSGTAAADQKAMCVRVPAELLDPKSGNAGVSARVNGENITTVKTIGVNFYKNGALIGGTPANVRPGFVATNGSTMSLAVGDVIEAAIVLDGYPCPVSDKRTIA